jgi:hypothetical protein
MIGSRIVASTLLLLLAAWSLSAHPLEIPITAGADDGVERDDLAWDADASPLVIGRDGDGAVCDVGLRFVASGLAEVDSVLFARLRFASRGGAVADSLSFVVTGVLEPESGDLSAVRRPSLLPRTAAMRLETLRRPWHAPGTKQLFYYTGDLAPIVNEIIAQPDWGGAPPALILCLDDVTANPAPTDHVACAALGAGSWPVTLQVARTISETLVAHEIVGRPTDHSATINFASLIDLEAYVEYGVESMSQQTEPEIVPADTPHDVALTGLAADTEHVYRLCYRRAGATGEFKRGEWRRFRTQRPPGASFRFTVQADSHIWDRWANDTPDQDALRLYQHTIANVAADQPDFHLSLGDYSQAAFSLTRRHAMDHYLLQRRYLDPLLHSVPFYLVLGNHEGELGYTRAEGDSVPAWAEYARRAFVPNPHPDGFYTGCPDPPLIGDGWRESYYAWEWGDALFVVLDPFWATTERPFHNDVPADGTGWNWTLGQAQYEWLHETLAAHGHQWAFVFIHHLVGGVGHVNDYYGRGGIEAAKFAVSENPSFEWGGEDAHGFHAYAERRPGWSHGPIHDMLVEAGVDAVFSGHDHFYAYQELDGVAYVTCPQPHDHWYTYGGLVPGQYVNGTLLPNSGHVRVDVLPHQVVIEYVRAFLAGDGPDGEVAHRQVIGEESTAATPPPAPAGLLAHPNPSSGQTVVRLREPGKAAPPTGELRIHDVAGRLVRVVPAAADGRFTWDQRDARGRPVASGTYHGRLRHEGQDLRVRMAVVR